LDINISVSCDGINLIYYCVNSVRGSTTPKKKQTRKAINANIPISLGMELDMLKNKRLIPKLSGHPAHKGYREGSVGGGSICVGVMNIPNPIRNSVIPAGNVAFPPPPFIADISISYEPTKCK